MSLSELSCKKQKYDSLLCSNAVLYSELHNLYLEAQCWQFKALKFQSEGYLSGYTEKMLLEELKPIKCRFQYSDQLNQTLNQEVHIHPHQQPSTI